jgi:hypothetical protein
MLAAHPNDNTRTFAASRRQLIFGAALTAGLAGAAGLIPCSAAAQSKLSQADSGYQTRPNGGQRCELCAHYQAPASCKVVAGPISPSGWCSLFAARKS